MPDPGPALDWTEEELDGFGEPRPRDGDKTRSWWYDHAARRYATLIDARPEPQTDEERERLAELAGAMLAFLWREQEAVFVWRHSGRAVPGQTVRSVLDDALSNAARDMRTQTARLQAGKINLVQWQIRMMRNIRGVHLASASLARGGWWQMTNADIDRALRMAVPQYRYLRRFALQIQAGAQRLDGTALRRAEMYGQAGRATYHAFQQLNMAARGYDEVRSVLNPAEHCRASSRPGCVEEAARGFVPIGTLTPLGSRTCLVNDKCSLEYRNSITGETRLVA